MDAEPELRHLTVEWLNKGHESMQPLLRRLLALKREKTYEEAMFDVATYAVARHAHDLYFVAHLLYLVDERRFPVIKLQRICNIHEGHLYRTLERAGVDYAAAQSKKIVLDDELTAWPVQLFIDPAREIVAIDGVEYGFDDPRSPITVWLDEEEIFRVAWRDGAKVAVP